MSNVVHFPTPPIRADVCEVAEGVVSATIHRFPSPTPILARPDDSLRADCERLMRRLVKSGCAFEHELRDLADLLDTIIPREERSP